MDRFRFPRAVMEFSVALMAGGLFAAAATTQPWQISMGRSASCRAESSVSAIRSIAVSAERFIRKRGCDRARLRRRCMGSMTLLPWVQSHDRANRLAHRLHAMGILWSGRARGSICCCASARYLGLEPDGDAAPRHRQSRYRISSNPVWAGTDWTHRGRFGTARFFMGGFRSLFRRLCTSVRVAGFTRPIPARHRLQPNVAVWDWVRSSLLCSLGQSLARPPSDRVGREWIWVASCSVLRLLSPPRRAEILSTFPLVYLMSWPQGALGYGLTSIMGRLVLEISRASITAAFLEP